MKTLRILLLTLVVLSLSACGVFGTDEGNGAIEASGVMSAADISVAPELSGKVVEVLANEGDAVNAGDELFKFDCDLMDAQRAQAAAGVSQAEAAVASANAAYNSAVAQYDLTLQGVEQQNTPSRTQIWNASVDSAFNLPTWYFQQDEQVAAAQAEVDAATAALADEKVSLQDELEKASNADFIAAEKRLAEAQVAFNVATTTHEQAQSASDNTELEDVTQTALDSAENELNSAQSSYDRMLTTSAANSVLEARARVSAAQARLDNARDALSLKQVGLNSLQLRAVETQVEQASAAITQAESGLEQAQASLDLVDLQVKKCVVTAPIAGVITAKNVEAGEIVAAGGTLMVISDLDPLMLTVYVPETQYGQIDLGQRVSISIDSFADQTFSGTVSRIAEEGEFTPRNVSTADGRRSTVYAVKIEVPNPDGLLKPGMVVDVVFLEN